MASQYIPYILIILIFLFIGSCVYVWKHRAELFEMTGMDPSQIPGSDKLKLAKKKPKQIHPNAKKSIKYKPPSVVEEKLGKLNQGKSKQEVGKRAPKQEEKRQPKIIKKNKALSDLPLKTNETGIKSMVIGKDGFLVAVGKDRFCHIYVPIALEIGDILNQHFQIDENSDVSFAALFRQPDLKIAYIDQTHKKLCISKIVIEGEDSKFMPKEKQEIASPFKNSVQGFIAHPLGEYIALICDQYSFKLYSTEGEEIYEQVFEGKRCNAITATDDYSRIFVSNGMNVTVFDWNSKKKTLTQKCEVSVKSTVLSLAYLPKSKELVVATDFAVTIFPKKIEKGKEKESYEMPGCKLVAASQISPLVAVICGKSKMRIIDVGAGKLIGELAEAHEGEINNVVWSLDNKWIFVSSRSKPNIESFRYSE